MMSRDVFVNSGFYPFSSGQLFLHAKVDIATENAVLILPPFAEEMNKTRHLINTVMQQLAAADCNCFMLDNFGTGDSEGDLDQASVGIWRNDIQQFIALLQQDGYQRLSVVAIRFGALQLFDLLNNDALGLPMQNIVLWQPIFDVKKFWQQFVRIKVAEVMASGKKVSQKDLEQQLLQGNTIEIAGYPISPDFYQSLLSMQTAIPAQLQRCQLSWFETSQLENIALPVQNMLLQFQENQDVNFVQLKAEPYWQTTELANADELITLTVQQLVGGQQ
ncbi:MAG: glycosyl transferase [Rheinheimera sp.]|nr:glycosyl transferase [Rheinheimera sp.]